MASTAATQLEVTRLTGALGAEVRGVDLGSLDDDTFGAIHELLLEHLVLFFPGQDLSPEAHIAFAARFGEVHVHPIARGKDQYSEMTVIEGDRGQANNWHTDVTFQERPPMASILKMVTLPSVGGDTLWTNQYLVYERLSEPMRAFLDGLTAVHSSRPAFAHSPETTATHPVVRVHPETGRRSLFVNGTFTKRIVELSRGESDALLNFLYRWSERPEFQCRYKWAVGTVGIWDNRCTQHYAVGDYDEFRRAERVTVTGDMPKGLREMTADSVGS